MTGVQNFRCDGACHGWQKKEVSRVFDDPGYDDSDFRNVAAERIANSSPDFPSDAFGNVPIMQEAWITHLLPSKEQVTLWS